MRIYILNVYIYVLPANKHSQNLDAPFLSLETEEATVAFNYCLQTNEEVYPGVYCALQCPLCTVQE